MGVDFCYQAIPDDCIILKKAKSNPRYAEYLTGPGNLHGGRTPGPDDEIYEEFMADVDEMLRHHPDLVKRYYSVDRCWDVLHFLLSEEGRQGRDDGTDLGTITIYGTTEASCLTDWPRYSSPAQVESVVVFLNHITEPELLR